ncbi:alpha/beta fold hydrolase [Ottowia thiooxydans]|uniref:alpha/beta fold hydrolase n=1 Tax=Ottowia thiooxydans TaxID=219182 RepID=UPI00146D675F|nr:alpha/beta hydrolase [Ottowia thiooxydans]
MNKRSLVQTAPVWTSAPMPSQAPAQQGWVDVGGARLWYWDTGGTGQPVVFMHAGSQSGAGWGYQQPVFARAGFRAIGYSRRGYFRSEAGNPDDPGMASEDLRKLIDHLGLERIHLVALAHGAFFALDFALVYPEKLRSLTIASSYLGIDESETEYVQANSRLRPPQFNALPVEFKELHPSYRAGNPAGMVAWLELNRESLVEKITPMRPFALTWARVESIRTPALLLTGDGDLYTPPALLRMQASHMPHADVVIIKEAGHCANWEQPAAFNEAVLEFIGRHNA